MHFSKIRILSLQPAMYNECLKQCHTMVDDTCSIADNGWMTDMCKEGTYPYLLRLTQLINITGNVNISPNLNHLTQIFVSFAISHTINEVVI